ncbi:PREDICTED: FHA domain-containing protein PS1 [Theobroma cacao]|uniref:FHA domain-containing protein PS1 n=1 Tax=Theobroma cacao TaxID=3641 RepID=A0AB32UX00_THECC|nr:PREDICTED: FHA domain-containing protein PS1 [Theobroma cacao]
MTEAEERKIPVFTVIKNGAILKNIFVINKPREMEEGEEYPHNQEETEERLIVGRHPDCNIMLTHPSISRFHLQIHSKPSFQKLSVLDLSSVHGTWVSGKKIDPGVVVELNEGDTIKIGGSTRLYKLHWIPMTRAYDMESPYVSSLDVPMEEEKEEESAVQSHQGENTLSTQNECIEGKDSLLVEGKEEEASQSCVPAEDEELQLMDWMLEGIVSLFSDESSGVLMKKEIPSAPPMPENMNFSIYDEEESTSRNNLEERELLGLKTELSSNFSGELDLAVEGYISESQNQQLGKANERILLETVMDAISEGENSEMSLRKSELKPEHSENIDPSFVEKLENYSATEIVEESESKRLIRESQQKRDVSRLSSEPHLLESINSTFQDDVSLNIKSHQVHKENQTPKPLSTSKPMEERGNKENTAAYQQSILMVNLDSTCSDGCKDSLSGKVEDAENQNLSRKDYESDDARVSSEPYLLESINSTFQEDILLNIKSQQVYKENQTPKPLSTSKPMEERGTKENTAANQQLMIVNLDSTCSDGCKDHLSGKVEDAENQNGSRKDYKRDNTNFYSAALPTESVKSSLPIGEVLSDVTDDKRNPTPQSLFSPAVLSEDENLDSSPSRLEKKSNLHSIWSRRGKLASVLHIQTGRSKEKAVEATNNAENKSITKSLLVSSEEEGEEEIFTPDKENFTPNTLLMKALKRKGKLEEIKHSSKVTFSPDLQPEDDIIASDEENQTQKLIKELKSVRKASRNHPKLQERIVINGKAERVPFQSLLPDSACKSASEASIPKTAARSSNSNTLNSKTIDKRIAHPSLNESVGAGRGIWTMVADTTSLMDKESRKSLQLLQGLKGTRLIIPRSVIRELDCLKRRGSLFRRITEASLVLEWIEACLVKTKWWIHVQSTLEGVAIAPTPPATPQSQFSEGSVGNLFGTTWSAPLSSRGSLMDIASPTTEDHILDCALLFRKMKSDGQLILLSSDITLKIKAMAEGLICETVQEFRESLVNPFSERFMWADSSPRGQSWTVLDDVVLREKYNRCPLKKPSKGDAKGLKLILLHNSHYGHISSVR